MSPGRGWSVAERIIRFLVVWFGAALLTAIVHELGHWTAGTLLGNQMTLSLNAALVVGEYRQDWHAHLVSAAGPLVTITQAALCYTLIRRGREATLMPLLLTAFVYRAMAGVMNLVNPNDEGRLSVWLGLEMWVLPAAVTGGLLWLLVDAVRRTDYGLTRSVVAAVVAVHLLGLLVLVDQNWSLRLL